MLITFLCRRPCEFNTTPSFRFYLGIIIIIIIIDFSPFCVHEDAKAFMVKCRKVNGNKIAKF